MAPLTDYFPQCFGKKLIEQLPLNVQKYQAKIAREKKHRRIAALASCKNKVQRPKHPTDRSSDSGFYRR